MRNEEQNLENENTGNNWKNSMNAGQRPDQKKVEDEKMKKANPQNKNDSGEDEKIIYEKTPII